MKEVRRLYLLVCVLSTLAMVGLPPSAAAQGETGNVCVRDFRSGAVCTANDVRIEALTVVSVVEDCITGGGETEVVFEALVSSDGSPDRFDIGLFLALDGGSARDGDQCYHDFLSGPLAATPTYGDTNSDTVPDIDGGPWWNGGTDADQCGDIEASTQVFKTLPPLRFACVDTNGDGSADVSVCTSWDNNTGSVCNTVADAFPGTNSKCSCAGVELGIPPEPELTVTKTPPTQTVISGGSATFTITLDSRTILTGVSVSDPLCTTLTGPTGDDGDNALEITETWTFTCTVTNVTAGFTNMVTANATSPNGPVSDSDTAVVTVDAPGISVSKTPPTQSVSPGGTANFTITVDNTGNVDLADVTVSDPQCTSLVGPTGDDGDSVLETAETWTFTCSVTNVTAGFINTVDVTADPPSGPDVSGSATAEVTVNAPSVTVSKTPPTQSVLSGGTATFTITVDNSGDEDLFDVTVSDPQCTTLTGPAGDDGDSVLETTETWTFSCSVTNVTADFTNTVSVTATPADESPDVSDTDSADVTVASPSLAVSKTPDSQSVPSGGTASFTIAVDNTGNVDLTSVAISDPQCSTPAGPTGDDGDGVLETTETWTYTCSASNVTADFTNTATVTATPPVGPVVSDSDDAGVVVAASQPLIVAAKESDFNLQTGDLDNSGSLSPGDRLQYIVTIRNDGGADALNVVFTDTPDPNTALVVGSVTTSLGTVQSGNVSGDTTVTVDIGTLPATGQVVVTFDVTIDRPFPAGVTQVLNQGLVLGDNFSDVPTDDPDTTPASDATQDVIAAAAIPIPTLSEWSLLLFVLLLGAAATWSLRRV